VVKDIEKASEKYSRLFGVPKPDYIITDELDKARTTYRDRPSPAQAKLAFFDLGKIRLELIEPLGEPSTWLDGLQANGESFHHLAFVVEDTPRRPSKPLSSRVCLSSNKAITRVECTPTWTVRRIME
jgi:hypothetical protein